MRHPLNARRSLRRHLEIESLEARLHLSAAPPNIVLINTDDQRFDTLDFMPFVSQTLAENGTEFKNSFVTTALCCPSRASLLKGQYAHNTGVWFTLPPTGGYENFDDSETIATMLQDTGYRTALIGKYINGYNRAVHADDVPGRAFVPPGWDEWQALITNGYYNYSMSENGSIRWFGDEPADYQTDVLAGKAIDFIHDAEAEDEQPFFLYFTPFAPHLASPTQPADRHIGAFDGIAPHRPPSFNEADISDKTSWAAVLPELEQGRIDKIDKSRQQQLEALLAVDEAIASITSTLTALEELDNTVIIFTSDNGLHWGEHRFDGKLTAFEESIRVPLVVYDGRSALASQEVEQLTLNIDIAPTLLDLAGAEVPDSMDGVSLVPLIEQEPVAWRTDFLVQNWIPDKFEANGDGTIDDLYQTTQLAVRSEEWMFIADQVTGGFELYDMINDPYQLENRYEELEFTDIVSHNLARIEQLSSSDTLGPHISDLRLEGSVTGHDSIRVRAMVSDLDAGGNHVRSPEAFVDTPGRSGEGIPFRPVDGKFDSATEEVELIFTHEVYSHFTYGTHTLLVHGRDKALNWGPFKTLTLHTGIRYDEQENLTIVGTNDADQIEITESGDAVTIRVNQSPAQSFELLGSLFIYGHEGDDLINAAGPRAKTIYGGGGDDLIRGGSGDDFLHGAAGNDTLVGNGGDDNIRGGLAADRIFGGVGNDRLRGDYGEDYLNGGLGDDILRGGHHDDRLIGGAGRDRLFGDQDHDTAEVAGDIDWRVTATAINGEVSDTIDTIERVVIDGGPGANRIDVETFQGTTLIRAHAGNDTIIGSAFVDTVYAGDGDDSISAGGDADQIHGGTGNDFVLGGDGDDLVYGGPGADLLYGQGGSDRIWGDAGDDQVVGALGDDVLRGGDGNDALSGDTGDDLLLAGAGDDVLRGHGGNDTMYGSDGDDLLEGDSGDDLLFGGKGDDRVFGHEGDDALYGQAGDDLLDADGGDDLLRGGEGHDHLVGGDGQDRLFGEAGDDWLEGGLGDDELLGMDGDDLAFGAGGVDIAFGGNGFDILVGGTDEDRLYGGHQGDILIGGIGRDALLGEAGDDILVPSIGAFDDDVTVLKAVRSTLIAGMPIDDRITAVLYGDSSNPALLPSGSVLDDIQSEGVWTGSGNDWALMLDGDRVLDMEPTDRQTDH